MAREDAQIVKEFKEFGKALIRELLAESRDGFIDKEDAYLRVVEGFKEERGWPDELTRLERKPNSTELRPVYVNRLHWITASLTSEKVTEKVSGRPFIALKGKLDAALLAYGQAPRRRSTSAPPNTSEVVPSRGAEKYTIGNIQEEGCFLPRRQIETLIKRLQTKKNLVLQGPPGTGKTWLGRRLGFALIGSKNPKKLRAVQFHPNLSYEDFVRGWRPTSEGQLAITEGVFMEAIDAALAEPEEPFVVLIEEINRGNPAQIFGELLTLLEAGKRNSAEALELSYPDAEGVRTPVHIPSNLYVIGTMNIADRSLALVDLALRRRFAFTELKPSLNEIWRGWIVENGIVPEV